MNVLGIRATLACLLVSAVTTFAQNQRLDIMLEGPWILYEDHNFYNAETKTDVLIAMAPSGTDHNDPTFSTGDGFTIPWKGVYCVAFGAQCARKQTATSLGTDHYPNGQLLSVKSKGSWDWYRDRDKSAIYLILPMPDSFSNDGTDKVRFGKAFGTYGNPAPYSIGTQFHYDNGPTTLNLYRCAPNPKINATYCSNTDNFQDQGNTGTLRITMRAPEDDDECSPHVRMAYPQMLLLLDSSPLSGGKNTNQDKAYIDLPNGQGTYGSCYDCDPQNPHPSPTCDPISRFRPLPPLNVGDELAGIVEEFKHLREDQRMLVYAQQLAAVGTSLKGKFPNLSQLPRIEKVLTLSLNGAAEVLRQLRFDSQSEAKAEESTLVKSIQGARLHSQNLAHYVQSLLAALDGKDCRAVQMLVAQ